MRELSYTNKFIKDYNKAKKRGYNMNLLEEVVDLLLTGNKLPKKYCEHYLVGKYKGFSECHILPDWLLIFQISDDNVVLTVARTGTHSDLFG